MSTELLLSPGLLPWVQGVGGAQQLDKHGGEGVVGHGGVLVHVVKEGDGGQPLAGGGQEVGLLQQGHQGGAYLEVVRPGEILMQSAA